MSKKSTTTVAKTVKKVSKKKVQKKDATKDNKAITSTQFKAWCFKNSISQVKLREDTKLSIGCIHGLWNMGKATASTIKLVALVYGLDEEKLKKKITTFEKVDNKMKSDTVFNPDNKLSLD